MLLKDRIALVTGAGSGIGKAVSCAFAREGATVILVGRTQENLEQTYDQIAAKGGRATIVPLDLEKELPRIPELAASVAERYGRLDILVNNAAQLGVLTPLDAVEPSMWETLLRVNLTAPWFLTKEMMPLLRRSEAASVINVSSSVGHEGRAYWGAYAASKAALNNITETWAAELSNTDIRVNTVNPGGTATPMRAQAFPGESQETLPTADQVARVFLYLASHASDDVNGVHLNAREWMTWQPV
ncbi:MAG: SDR family NAD(P)-dependent oxidoreductase [Magnetococcales bacterium]|nr:SDR family NAD(P)-dependent oxidoreductase [Magnetococcales bacterium]